MDQLLDQLKSDYPNLAFELGASPCWSPQDGTVFYRNAASEQEMWALLHEVSHACLHHTTYTSDVDLLQKEVAAWRRAQELAEKYDIIINNEHIQNCLDTYRDWLYKRSTCPTCRAKGVQQSAVLYLCINCQSSWRVTNSRFGRPYRLRISAK
jgi:Zn-dependent peptidase ImmA (M78 family)